MHFVSIILDLLPSDLKINEILPGQYMKYRRTFLNTLKCG